MEKNCAETAFPPILFKLIVTFSLKKQSKVPVCHILPADIFTKLVTQTPEMKGALSVSVCVCAKWWPKVSGL